MDLIAKVVIFNSECLKMKISVKNFKAKIFMNIILSGTVLEVKLYTNFHAILSGHIEFHKSYQLLQMVL